jgi:hypothetical protein
MKLKGTIQKSDLEGGHWVLRCDSGEYFQLGGALASAKDGMRVELEGSVDRQAAGIAMSGPQFNVAKITAL